jgi:flagellin
MAFTVNTNVASLLDQNFLNGTQAEQTRAVNRLSSGLRIINSGDDAAGLAIANGLRSDEAVLTQGVRNGNDGLSALQVADGGLGNISQLLDRARTLATQSASGTFTGDRSVLNSEFQSVLAEIDRQSQAIGLNTGGTFATALSVFIGGGTTSNGISATTNGSVTFDLSKSTVDTKSLGLKGDQAIGIAGTDIGNGSSTNSVSLILANTANTGSEATPGNTVFYVSGPGFSGANEVALNVNLSGVTDANTLVTAINQAITNAGNASTQAATAFKNANVTAAINTDSTGKQQLTFNSSSTAFQVEAGDRVANAFLGNFVGGGSTGPVGKDLTNTITGATTTATALTANSTIVRIQGSGLASPVDITLAASSTAQNAIDSLNNQVSSNAALTAAGITVSDPTAGSGAVVFTSKRGEQFSASVVGDLKNTLGLGTWQKNAAQTSFDNTTVTAGAAITTGGTQTDKLEFSINGGPVQQISVTLLAADTAAQINDKINTALSSNAALAAAGLTSTQAAGVLTIASTNGTAFRVREAGGAAANQILGFATGSGTDAALGQSAAADTALTQADNTDNIHFNSNGESATGTFQWANILNGQDAQTVTYSANDATGAAHTTQVVLQNNSTARNARSLDEAIATINTALQQTNDSTLKQIVAVKQLVSAGVEGIKFVSALGSFSATLSQDGTGGTVGIGQASDQGKVQASAVTAGGSTADISNVSTATAAVTALAASITLLGKSQGVIGRSQNQLNFAITLAQSQLTNKAAAESRIRDADLAAESANLTRSNILLQAGVAALAQANSAPQQVLALLRF